ncbi:MAG: cell division protein SepF [Cyanobacteria bacterium P01_A01_bin.17]
MDKMVPFLGMNGYTILVLKLKSFSDADDAIAALKAGHVLLLNLSRLQPQSIQRMTDYIAGSTYALAGQQVEVGSGLFLFTPPAIGLTAGSTEQKRSQFQANSA